MISMGILKIIEKQSLEEAFSGGFYHFVNLSFKHLVIILVILQFSLNSKEFFRISIIFVRLPILINASMNSEPYHLEDNQLLEILLQSPLATAVYTTENIVIQFANDAMISFWGKDRSVIGKLLIEAIPELEGQPFVDILKNVWRTGITYQDVNTPADLNINNRTTKFYFDFVYKALKNDAGKVYAILHTAVDVTERNLNQEKVRESEVALTHEQALNEELATSNEELFATIEELNATQEELSALNNELEDRVSDRTKALAASEERIRYMLDDAPVAITLLTGKEMIIEAANKKILEAWGKNGEVIGKPLSVALPELKGQQFLQLLDEVYQTGKPYYGNEVKALLEKNGILEEVYSNFVYQPIRDVNGITSSIIVTANVITEQVLARKKVEHSEHRLRSMVTNAPIGMTILRGRELIVEIANQPMLEIWNHSKEEVLGWKLRNIFPELSDQPYIKLLQSVFDTGKAVKMPELEADIISPHGNKRISIDFSYDPLFDANGEVEAILATMIDITEKVESRKLLENSEKEQQAINEELSATIEELAAANEEHITINEELSNTQDNLQQMINDLARNEARSRFMLNAIPQQVWTSDPEGALDYVNQVVCNDFGYNTEEIVGHGWKKFIHPDDLDLCLKKWKTALETGLEYLVEFRLLFGKGTYHWHLARALPFIEDGQIRLWLGTNTNIEIQKENEMKKDEFLSIASHELKTPLTSIKAFNQLLLRVKDPVVMANFAQKSSEHIARLERLISDLLDVTKINAGKMQYNMEPFNFGEMVSESIKVLQHTSPDHEIILQSNADIEYTGDQFRLELVINNFISNAVKYSPEGEKVVVNSKVVMENIVVSVQDFGIGIAEENLDKLFDRYYRVDNTAMRFEGLGLGLFISSEILKRHHGSFWIESLPGKGSTFYFRLPLYPDKKNEIIENTDSFYKDSTITIKYNELNNRIELDWTGFQNFDTVQKGCFRALEMQKIYRCKNILNDNRSVLGTWSEASDWVGNIFFPIIEKEGVKRIAWIFSASAFSLLAARKSIDVAAGNITTQFFTDIDLARAWLSNAD